MLEFNGLNQGDIVEKADEAAGNDDQEDIGQQIRVTTEETLKLRERQIKEMQQRIDQRIEVEKQKEIEMSKNMIGTATEVENETNEQK